MGHLQEPAGVSPWGEERDYDAETGHLETPGRPPVSERRERAPAADVDRLAMGSNSSSVLFPAVIYGEWVSD